MHGSLTIDALYGIAAASLIAQVAWLLARNIYLLDVDERRRMAHRVVRTVTRTIGVPPSASTEAHQAVDALPDYFTREELIRALERVFRKYPRMRTSRGAYPERCQAG